MVMRAHTMHLMHASREPGLSPKISSKAWEADEILSHSTNDLTVIGDGDGERGLRYSPMQSRKQITQGSFSSLSSSNASSRNPVSPKLKIEITEKVENGEGSIYYKDDEDRFSQRYTIKLKTFSEYNIVLEAKPPQKLLFVKIGDLKYEKFTEIEDEAQDEKATYKFVWSTDRIRTTKRKHRSILPCYIKFEHCKEIKFDMFVKFYFSCEVAHYNGIPFSFIELAFHTGGSNSSRNLMSQKVQIN